MTYRNPEISLLLLISYAAYSTIQRT